MARIQALSIYLAIGVGLAPQAAAEETSTNDKLRILYSNRFTFDDDGTPIVTVELVSRRNQVALSSPKGMIVEPDGIGGTQISAAGRQWTISLENSRRAVVKEWVIAGTFGSDQHKALQRALNLWRARGYKPKTLEVGSIFSVAGKVVDNRKTLLGVVGTTVDRGRALSQKVAKRWRIKTTVHPVILKRPSGTIVARSGNTTIRNANMMWFRPKSTQDTLTVPNVPSGTGGSQLQTKRETRHYWGRIYITIGPDGKLIVANSVSVDKLLEGLVPAEMFASAPDAALEAQAIAARTTLLQNIGQRHHIDPFVLCSDQQCQVYSGAGREHPRTSKAVRKTRGAVLVRTNGKLVDARYSAACGGFSEHNETIWGGKQDLALRGHIDAPSTSAIARRFGRGIDDTNIEAFLAASPRTTWEGRTRYGKGRYRWHVSMSAAKLSRRVRKKYPQIGSIVRLIPLTRGISGRIQSIKLVGNRGHAVVSGDLRIRRLLGGLKSTLFVVETHSRRGQRYFDFRGAGFGHGVGLCQTGAIGMAEAGKSRQQILSHYYRNTKIRSLY